MLKRIICGCLCGILLATAQEVEAGQVVEEEPVTLVLSIMDNDFLDSFKMVSEYIEERTGIHLEVHMRPSGIEGDNYLRSLLTMGGMADFYYYNSGALFQLLNPEVYFEDLSDTPFSDYIDEDMREMVSADGKLYGIPVGELSAGGWVYNKELHEQLNLHIPQTWEGLMENCEVFQEHGITPVAAGYGDKWISQIILLSDYHNLVHEEPEWTEQFNHGMANFSGSPAAMRGFEKLYELSQRGYLDADAEQLGYADACRMVAEGECAYMPALTYALNDIAAGEPQALDKIGFFGQPGEDAEYQGITLWYPRAIYVAKDSKHPEAIQTWLELFLSEEGQKIFYGNTEDDGNRSGLEVESKEKIEQLIEEYRGADRAAFAMEYSSPLKTNSLYQITLECGLGLITPEEAAKRYDEDIRQHAMLMNLFQDIPGM